jgi:hypothetical protein
VLEAIRQAQPPRLYVAADGPRPNRPGEAEKVQAVRDYVMGQIDWPCEVKTLFREKNLGCKVAVSSAIDWFFDHEPEGIILEDDCVPHPSFFQFCQELLEKYRDDDRIMQISGDNFQNGISRTQDSYYFSYYTHIWGWASWRRAWQHYDKDMKLWNKQNSNYLLRNIGAGYKPFERYWSRIFEKVSMGRIDAWDYVWTFSCWAQGGLIIIPEVNLVENIGFGPEATHTKTSSGQKRVLLERSGIKLPLKHPKLFVRSFVADRYTDRKHFGIRPIIVSYVGLFLRIPRKLIKILKIKSM